MPVSSGDIAHLKDLKRALRAIIDSGRVGIPVCLRVHVQLRMREDSPTRMSEVAKGLQSLAVELLSMSKPKWKQRGRGRLLNVLGTDERGRSALLTFNQSGCDQVSLTLIGNRGVVRLENVSLADVEVAN